MGPKPADPPASACPVPARPHRPPGRIRAAFLGLVRLLPVLAVAAAPAAAAEARIAVAANFAEAARRVFADVADGSGHVCAVVQGATGTLAAQILAGAPFDAFLAADAERPARLADAGRVVPGSRFTYALGRLALWHPDPGRFGAGSRVDGPAFLRAPESPRIALADPALAPYGVAARQVLRGLGAEPRIVLGRNVAHTFALAATGHVDAAFVALAQVRLRAGAGRSPGSLWAVPAGAHDPVRQDAVLLRREGSSPRVRAAARTCLGALRGPEGRRRIRSLGYGVPDAGAGSPDRPPGPAAGAGRGAP